MFQIHSVTQKKSNSGISSYLVLLATKLKRFQTKQASSVKWRKLCNNDVSLYRTCSKYILLHKKRQIRAFQGIWFCFRKTLYRTCSKYILLHRKHQIRAFQAIWNCLQQNWSGFRRNKFSPSSDASYVTMTFLFIGRVRSTFCYTENIKFGHFKLFGTVYSKTEAVSDETSFLR